KFSKAEIAKLAPLVEGEEYQRLRKTDTAEYRSAWLQKRMGAASDEVAWSLLLASWSTDQQPERKARYQREFVTAVNVLAAGTENLEVLQLRAANALRELSDHRASNEWLTKLAPTLAAQTGSEEGTSVNAFAARLRTLNQEQNAKSEPITVVPEEVAAELCAKPTLPLTESERQLCASPRIKELMDRFAANRAN
ncbi:MAG TPA: hypothetical protein VGB39_06870, partial [Sphingomicrobium sp.]